MNNNNIKPRLHWVDTAKGICILLVILAHTTENVLTDFPHISTMLRAIRMPLYYTIAGLFISIHSDSSFIEKKINKLIIPYCFFVLLGNITGYIKHMVDGVEFTYFSPLYYAITEDKDWLFYNFPIWFLVSLFDVYIIYLIINKIACNMPKHSTFIKVALSICAGLGGFACNRRSVDLPFFLDSSLSAMPFFIFGHISMSKTKLFKREYNRIILILFTIFLFSVAFITAEGDIDYYRNNPRTSLFHAYFPCMIGVTAFLLLSKLINKIPIITRIGRFSIAYLGTHALFLRDIRIILETQMSINNGIIVDIITFVTTILLSSISCWIMLKYVPFLIAQQDCVYFCKKNK